MNRHKLLIFLVSTFLFSNLSNAGAIYGGTSAISDPRVVGFVENRDSNTTLCSGALISSRTAVSVAHCFLNRPNLLAIAPGAKASGEREVFKISKVIFVPGYFSECGDLNNQDNRYKCTVKDDFVFVLFETDVIANYKVEIANKNDIEEIKSQNKPLTLYGYGFTNSLRDLTGNPKKLSSNARLKLIWPDGHLLPPEEKVLMFTEELKNSVCTGDSGGPVYSGDKIVSVINSGNGCGPTEVANGGMSTVIYQYLYLLEAVEKAAAEKAAAEKAAADKAAADKAAADKIIQDAKLEAAKIIADAKAAAIKKITITCVKGKITKKVAAVKPKCPSGYNVKK